MSELTGLGLKKAPYFANKKNNENHVSEKLNSEYTDLMVIDGEIIKLEKGDEILPNDAFSKFRTNLKQSAKLPKYAANGLKGDKNNNFFEFLQLAKIPYWIGGPMLVWAFRAGGEGSVGISKQKAAGVAFYYLAAMAAKTLIDKPVKLFKGIDLNRKYKDIVPLKTERKDGFSEKKIEYHGVYDSIDFTRWDLLYNENGHASKNPAHINKEYDKIADKIMGVDKELNDPDSTVKPYVKKIIVASRAWKSLLIVPLAGVAAGLSNYEGWKTWGETLKGDFKDAINPKAGISSKLTKLSITTGNLVNNVVKPHFIDPIKESFKKLWTGNSMNSNKFLGKLTILGSLAAVAFANYNILKISAIKEDKYIDIDNPEATKLKNKFNTFNSAPSSLSLSSPNKGSYTF